MLFFVHGYLLGVAFSGDGMDMDMDDGIGLRETQRSIPDKLSLLYLIDCMGGQRSLSWVVV